ncbi:MAG: T9SS type A sorting domain-containing protein [Bacteroidales bacterium]|nr:T9SS type A sorting domain-containing protein [Bacteroidales bacterium]
MKKRFLLLTLIMCLLGGINSVMAQEQTITIGTGKSATDCVPYCERAFTGAESGYSVSQQLYSRTDLEGLPENAAIKSISFFLQYEDKNDRNISVYMKNTDKTSNTNTETYTDNDKVFSGVVTTNKNNDMLLTITFTNDFIYTGNGIFIYVNDVTGTKTSLYNRFYYTSKSGGAIYGYNSTPLTTTDMNRTGNYINNIKITYVEGSSTPPTAPKLKSPADNATDQFNPTLSWTFGENTEEYQVLLVEASEDFSEVDAEKWIKTQNATEGSYTTSGLERGTKYKWKVVAKNPKGETSSDDIYTFTTLDIPTAPTLKLPTDEATVDINKPTLQFTLSNNTTQYQILLDKNENLTTVVKEGTYDNVNVSYQTSKLDAGATYYWKVIAKNDAGEAESDIYQFTTANILRVIDYEIKLDENNITLEWQYADQNANKYQVYFGKPEEDIVIWNNPEWVPRETVDGKLVDYGSFTITKDADFGDKVYFRVDVSDGEETVEGATVFCVILDKDTDWGDSYNNADYVFVRADVRVTTENITAKNITIENGGILKTIMNNVVVSANTLVVNEGGQFFATDIKEYFPINTVKFNKKIVNPEGEWNGANNKTGWQFISSPFTDAPISSFIPEEGEGDYDLYKYDGSAEKPWVNHKDSELAEPFAPGEKFAPGIGYLASYETKDNLTFTRSNGSINRTNTFNIGSDGMMETPGIYLLGNPFLFNMDWVKISTNGAYGINATSFVVVKADGAYEYKTSGEIKVGEGFFVLTTKDWAAFNCTFAANDIVAATSSKSRNAEQSKSLNIIATGNAGNDNVVVNFNGEGEGFPKLQNFNDDIATVYVQNNDANYGVYNCDENTTEVELCFNANQMGNYTISVEPTGEFSSIVLVDRFTGIETNLLVDDYHFTAMSEENNNRFFIRLGNGQQTTDNSHFVFQSGEELIIEAEGTVQIIDMMGRVVYTSNVENNNRINVSEFNNGAYVVRVINESEIKVEKVVIY